MKYNDQDILMRIIMEINYNIEKELSGYMEQYNY
jgi:hypothetical protein